MPGGKGKITGTDGKRFVRGDSRINRAGRPPRLPDLDELLREALGEKIRGKEAMMLIILALRKKALGGDIRASELLLDRAYGRVKQPTELDVKTTLTGLSEAELIYITNLLFDRDDKKG